MPLDSDMTFALVAFHYPKPQHRAELIDRVHQAAEVMRAVPGCLDVGCWEDAGSGAIVTTGKWKSRGAFLASLQAVKGAGVDFDYDDREARPREVFNLTSV